MCSATTTADELLARYHELEPELQRDGALSYREVMTESMRRLGAPAGTEHGLAESLPGWRAFPEVHDALAELRSRGWKLAILSNTDDDFIAASQVHIGVPIDEIVVAQEIGSYKPAHRHWDEFFAARMRRARATCTSPRRCSTTSLPRTSSGCAACGSTGTARRAPDAQPTRELRDLLALPETLDELVAA